MRVTGSLAVVAAMGLAGTALRAQDAVTEGEPMLVTAPPLVAEEALTPFGGSVTRIGREQLEGMAANDLASGLRRATGVTISRFNLLGAYGGAEGGAIYIRGRGASRPGAEIRTYMDGVPREVGVFGHPLLDTLPISLADGITVSKSPQPLLYGGVFGAVDVASSRREEAGYETRIDTSAGERDTFTLGVQHGGRIGAWDYYGGGAYLESEGHRDHSAAVLRSQYVQSGYALSDTVRLSYILHRTDNWGEDPGRVDGPTPVRDLFATETLTQSIQLRNAGERVAGYVLLYHEDGRIRWDRDNVNGPGTPAGDVDTDWRNFGLRGVEDLRLGAWTLTAGLDAERAGGETETRTLAGAVPLAFEDDYDTVAPALGLRVDVPVAGVTLTPSAGGRYFTHSEFGDEVSPQAGMVVAGGRWECFANYAEAVHYPGVYASGLSAGTLASLDAERMEHVEGGFGVKCPYTGARARLAVFRDEASDQLQWTPAGLVNRRESAIDGLEFSVAFTGRGGHSAFTGVTLLDADTEKTPRAPDVSASAGVVVVPVRHVSVQVNMQYVDAQYAFNGRTAAPGLAAVEKIDSCTVANARIGYAVHGSDWFAGEVYVSVENLTDETYEYQPGYPMPGRLVSAGLKTVF